MFQPQYHMIFTNYLILPIVFQEHTGLFSKTIYEFCNLPVESSSICLPMDSKGSQHFAETLTTFGVPLGVKIEK
jgi:hypothetical protein